MFKFIGLQGFHRWKVSDIYSITLAITETVLPVQFSLRRDTRCHLYVSRLLSWYDEECSLQWSLPVISMHGSKKLVFAVPADTVIAHITVDTAVIGATNNSCTLENPSKPFATVSVMFPYVICCPYASTNANEVIAFLWMELYFKEHVRFNTSGTLLLKFASHHGRSMQEKHYCLLRY